MLTAGRQALSGVREAASTVRARRTTHVLAAIVLVPWVLGHPGTAAAQGRWSAPTLQESGIRYVSPSGRVRVDWSGRIDLELLTLSAQEVGLVRGGGTFVSPRLSLFTDAAVGEHLKGLLELRGDRGQAPTRGSLKGRVQQAHLRWSGVSGRVSFQAGRFASPFGSYATRASSAGDPFVRPPLPYDYRTVISRTTAPESPAAFLTWRDNPDAHRPEGAPPVWGVPYQWGVMGMGSVDRVSYRFAAMNGAPSSEPVTWGFDGARFKHPSWILGLRVPISPNLSAEASYDTGPYLQAVEAGTLPEGRSRWDYRQAVWSANLRFTHRSVVASAEVLHDRWAVPNVGDDLVDMGYVGQVQAELGDGFVAGLRLSYLDFRPWRDTIGTPQPPWGYDVARWEGSLGYRFADNLGVLASGFTDRHRGSGAPADNLGAIRLWWVF